MIQIPSSSANASDFEQKITLEEQEIVVRLSWNSRSEFWFMDLDNQKNNLLSSRKLVPFSPLVGKHTALFPIAGDFWLLPEQDVAPEYPTFEGLGVTHNLYWLNTAENASMKKALGLA
jgi:hypothetical protein